MNKQWGKLPDSTKDSIREIWGKEPPVDIVDMAEVLGIDSVVAVDFRPGIAGEIVRQEHDKFKIRVNVNVDYPMQRFTIAHELAHYLIHKDKIGDGIRDSSLYSSDNLPDDKEMEANDLGLLLLTPDQLIKPALKKLDGNKSIENAHELAKKFIVPEWMMEIRLGAE